MPYKPYIRPAYPNELFHSSSELYHHGIKGQRWGVRRYQNPDGTLTEAGKKRYYKTVINAHTGQEVEVLSDKGRKAIDNINKNLLKDTSKYAKNQGYNVKPLSKDSILVSSKIDDLNEFNLDVSPKLSTQTHINGQKAFKTMESGKKELHEQVDSVKSVKNHISSHIKDVRKQMMESIYEQYKNPYYSDEWQNFGKNINFDKAKMSITSYDENNNSFQIRVPLIENTGGASPAYRNGEVWYAELKFDENGKPVVYDIEWDDY